MKIRTLGIDLGKTSFHAVASTRVARSYCVALLTPAAPPIHRDATAVSHRDGGLLRGASSRARLSEARARDPADATPIRPAIVKAQKNDYLAAEAIGEAVQRPTMGFVPLMTVDELDCRRSIASATGWSADERYGQSAPGLATRQTIRKLAAERDADIA